jgi:DNA-directed RNA polymerase specialized sigma24 family protein
MTIDQLAKIQWLNRAYDAEQTAKAWTAKLERDRSLAERTCRKCSQSFGSPSGNTTELLLIHLADTDQKTQDYLKEMIQIQNEITEAIVKIQSLELQTILIRRYLAHETFTQIAEQMHCDERTVRRKHLLALEKLEKF